MERDQIESLVEKVLSRLQAGDTAPANGARPEPPAKPRGVFKTVADAVGAARQAHLTLVALPLEKRREIIANIRRRCAEDVITLAKMAVEETGLGRVDDKIKKNLLVIHRTPGPAADRARHGRAADAHHLVRQGMEDDHDVAAGDQEAAEDADQDDDDADSIEHDQPRNKKAEAV